MKTGYLRLETHPEHPGLVRFLISDDAPDPTSGQSGNTIRYIARFNDIEAALMHVQNALHRSLMDVDNRLYRVDLPEAIAVVEADELRHKRIWMDATLSDDELQQTRCLTELHKSRKRRWDKVWKGIGYLFVVLIVLRALGLF
ncbi:MAG: hypothetical protein GY703_15130 [Gammaproteobacteria bacterium]|nr:hypothetical protein [Gammaproteobacteria bacterium]